MRRAAVFFPFFALYLWAMPPTLAPYRDAGEMTTAAHVLGVCHPPSYPLYALLGRSAASLPIGNGGYLLGLLSALAGALALTLGHGALRPRLGLAPAWAFAALLGLNATFWHVGVVQEMYSLMLALAFLLFAMAWRLREAYSDALWSAFCFAFGLALGNRTDLLLWAPGLLWLAWPSDVFESGRGRWAWLARSAAFLLLGLSVYAYLPLRSARGPWLDWNHPATLERFLASLTRRGYGGTLDLLSKSYAPGSMFLPNLKVYGLHLWRNFHVLGLALASLGAWSLSREDRRRLASYALLYLASGPLFLYLANMPPNPHALAVVEPHYLLSDAVLALLAAEGAGALPLPGRARAVVPLALCLQALLLGRLRERDFRFNFIGHDYSRNVLRSLPSGSVLVAKKDVQLFGLWHAQRVEGLRPDVHLVSQGLAHSAWYQAAQRRAGNKAALGPLAGPADWSRFLSENPGAFAGTDADLPAGLQTGSNGLVYALGSKAVSLKPWPFLLRRGDTRYESRPDFFSADLLDAYAFALQRLGSLQLEAGAEAGARAAFLSAWTVKWLMPEPPSYLGFMAFKSGNLPEAARLYGLSAGLYDRLLSLTRDYHSLPNVVEGIRQSAADVWLNLGVVRERSGDAAGAESAYRRALELNPRLPKAHFNIAVLHWNKDWTRAVAELESALRVDPANADALRYLPAARAKLGGH